MKLFSNIDASISLEDAISYDGGRILTLYEIYSLIDRSYLTRIELSSREINCIREMMGKYSKIHTLHSGHVQSPSGNVVNPRHLG